MIDVRLLERWIIRAVIFLGVGNTLSASVFVFRPNFGMQMVLLVSMLLLVGLFLIFFLRGIVDYSEIGYSVFMVPLIALAFAVMVIPAGMFGHMMRDWNFNRKFYDYKKCLYWVQNQIDQSAVSQFIVPPRRFCRIADKIIVIPIQGGGRIVEFHFEGGFPMKHAGYLYIDEMENKRSAFETMYRRWPNAHRIREQWFGF